MNKIAEVPIGPTFGSPFGVTGGKTLGSLVFSIVGGAIALASIILLFLLVIGGIGIIAGAGNDNPQQVESGKKAVTAAVAGFIIVFVAYWIIRILELITGVNFVTAPGI